MFVSVWRDDTFACAKVMLPVNRQPTRSVGDRDAREILIQPTPTRICKRGVIYEFAAGIHQHPEQILCPTQQVTSACDSVALPLAAQFEDPVPVAHKFAVTGIQGAVKTFASSTSKCDKRSTKYPPGSRVSLRLVASADLFLCLITAGIIRTRHKMNDSDLSKHQWFPGRDAL